MRRAVLLVGLAVSTAAAAPRPKGKVVRVERQRASAAAPRICEVHTDGSGVCFGAEPIVGDIVMVMDETAVVAETKVTESKAFQTGTQSCNALWNIKSDVLRGDMGTAMSRMFGVVDRDIHPRKGRILAKDQYPQSPSGDVNDIVMIAVDRDGDRTPDILVVQSNCDGSSSAAGGTCLDAWSRINGRMVRVQQTNFAVCGL